MVSSQEIVDRSIYMNILAVAINSNNTIDPDNYLDATTHLPTSATIASYNAAKAAISKFVYIFGAGNSQSRGAKDVPRITIDPQGYYPGTFGMERYHLDDDDPTNPLIRDTGYMAKDCIYEIHLVASTQEDIRTLHSIMYKALPDKGYIKPYKNEDHATWMASPKLLRSNNIYIEVTNYYNHLDTEHGLLEYVYQYNIKDGYVTDTIVDDDLVPISDISVIINNENANIEIERGLFYLIDSESNKLTDSEENYLKDRNSL